MIFQIRHKHLYRSAFVFLKYVTKIFRLLNKYYMYVYRTSFKRHIVLAVKTRYSEILQSRLQMKTAKYHKH